MSLVYAAVFGAVLYYLIYRPLRDATALTRVCASVGTMLALQAIAVLNFGTTAKSTPAILPNKPFKIGDITVPVDRLWFAGIVVVLAIALAAVYRFTRFGLATRAAAENEQGAALVGLSADRIAAGNWVLATILAGVAGILIAPVSTVDPSVLHLVHRPGPGLRAARAVHVVRRRRRRGPRARHAAERDHQVDLGRLVAAAGGPAAGAAVPAHRARDDACSRAASARAASWAS